MAMIKIRNIDSGRTQEVTEEGWNKIKANPLTARSFVQVKTITPPELKEQPTPIAQQAENQSGGMAESGE